MYTHNSDMMFSVFLDQQYNQQIIATHSNPNYMF